MTTPDHYQQCSAIGRPILIALGVATVLLDGKCEEAIAALHHTRNYWELSAFKYLWRAGEKGDPRPDLEKSLDCLTRLSPQLGGTVPREEVLEMIRDASRNVRVSFVSCSGPTQGGAVSSTGVSVSLISDQSTAWQIQPAPAKHPRAVTVRLVNKSGSPACFYVKQKPLAEVKDLGITREVLPGSAWVAKSGEAIGEIVEVVAVSEGRIGIEHPASTPVFRALRWGSQQCLSPIYRSKDGFYHESFTHDPKTYVVFKGFGSETNCYLPLTDFISTFAEPVRR